MSVSAHTAQRDMSQAVVQPSRWKRGFSAVLIFHGGLWERKSGAEHVSVFIKCLL